MNEKMSISDQLTTVVATNFNSLFNRSGKKDFVLKYSDNNYNDKYMLEMAKVVRMFNNYLPIYLKMPLKEYIKFIKKNWKQRKIYRFCIATRKKYQIEKERLLYDARAAYDIMDEEIYEKIYNEFYTKEGEI